MKLPSFYILLLSVLSQTLHCCCQQEYLNKTVHDCSFNNTRKEAYACNGLQKSCTSFVTFRSRPPYDNSRSIANLLRTEASSIASINNISCIDKSLPFNQIVIVPIYCSCSGNIYQHSAPFNIKKDDTYFYMANTTYQGLTTCQMLVHQNYYNPVNLSVGANVKVPMLCACPSDKQISDGVSYMLVHTLDYGDSLESVAQVYGMDQQALLTANLLPSNAIIPPLTPFLVPLKSSSCKLNPHMFYCICSLSQGYLRYSSFNTLYCDHLQTDSHRFPVRLVASLGNLFSILPRSLCF